MILFLLYNFQQKTTQNTLKKIKILRKFLFFSENVVILVKYLCFVINLLKRLNEPFPEKNSFREDFKYILGVGVFVTLFLYILRPFGIAQIPIDPFWYCAAFGGITILAAVLFELFSTYLLKIEKDVPSWTLGKWVLSSLGLIFFISIGNYAFLARLGWIPVNWVGGLQIFLVTLLVGVFPIVLSGLLIQMTNYKKNQIEADTFQSSLAVSVPNTKIITLSSKNNNQTLSVAIAHLLYLESMQNYVAVHYFEDEQLTKKLLRNTLSEVSNQLKETPVIRCHRSFLVNTDLIDYVEGNAQGLRVTLKNLGDTKIPVSRKYIPVLKAIV